MHIPIEEKKFRATAVARVPEHISDSEFDHLLQRVGGTLRHDLATERLHLVWRIAAGQDGRTAYDAIDMVTQALIEVFGERASMVSFTLEWME